MAYYRSTDDLNVIQGPTCIHLRSKGMYITGRRDPEDDGEIGDGHCWCNKTQNVLGPDDGLVDRPECKAARACYEGAI